MWRIEGGRMTRPIALRILTLAAGLGLLGQLVLIHTLPGINVPVLTIGLLGAAVLVRPGDRRIDRLDWWLPPAAVAVSIAVAVRADPFLILLDLGTAGLLLGASITALGGNAVTRRSAVAIVGVGLVVLGWVGIGVLRVGAALTQRIEGTGAQHPLPRWAGGVARGLVIALPVLVVFGVLFSAADAAFERLMGNLLGWQIDLGELPLRTSVAFLVAWAAAGLLTVAAGAIADLAPRSPGPPVAVDPGTPGTGSSPAPAVRLGATEAATILIAVDVLFAVFVVIQFAYLFGGLDTLAATGLPYAQYARRGFFELVAVAILAGGLLATVQAVAVRRTPMLVGAGLALAGLTAVVLGSALLRLRIYQDAYGWTELRFYVLATIVWLAIGIAITIFLLARDRLRWLLHGLTIAAVAVLLAANVVGPSRLIAVQNVARLLDPSLVPPDGRRGLDVGYAEQLGDDAVPTLVVALPALSGLDRRELLAELVRRRAALATPEAVGWPSWNLGRSLARDSLSDLPDR
jgi:hypothetical protein